jgi:hypothetical protein
MHPFRRARRTNWKGYGLAGLARKGVAEYCMYLRMFCRTRRTNVKRQYTEYLAAGLTRLTRKDMGSQD